MDYTFTVKRNRSSVTQGTATVYLNGAEIITFGDNIDMIKPDHPYYGENIGGLASTISDGSFVHGVLFHPFDSIYHHSDKVREMLASEGGPLSISASGKHAPPGRVYIDVDAKIATAATPEEKDAWEKKRAELERHSYSFCEGWHVGIYQHTCGHWEILQSPLYKTSDGTSVGFSGKASMTEIVDRELREMSAKSKCTRCICRL